jgi:hypothetical protein
MTVKSVIEIDVLDGKFKAFASAFEKYKKSVDAQSKQWEAFNEKIDEATKKQENFNKKAKDTSLIFKDMAFTTYSISRNLASMAVSAAKFIAFGAGTTGFGLGGLAYQANDYRKTAQGIGLGIGQLKAANVYYGKHLDNPEATLESIARISSNPGESWKLFNAGGDLEKNPYENLSQVLQTIKKQMGGTLNMAQANQMGWTDVLGGESNVRRLFNTNMDELSESALKAADGLKALEIEDKNAQDWQNFWISIKKAGSAIESSLINSLVKLTTPLQDLTVSFEEVITTFLKSEELKQGIEDFTKYLKDPEGQKAIKDFFEGLKYLGQGMMWVVGLIAPYVRTLKSGGESYRAWDNLVKNDYDKKFNHQYDKSLGLSEGEEIVPSSYSQGVNLKKVDPKLVAALKASGLDVISGYRTEEHARSQNIWNPGSHHTVLNEEGYATAVDVSKKSLKALRSKFKSDEEFSNATRLYAPYGAKDPNHLEYYDPNKVNVYMRTAPGSSPVNNAVAMSASTGG